MPKGWDFVYTDLEKRSPAKRCAFKTALDELVKAGYVWREKSPVRGRRDRIVVSEIPYTGGEWQSALRILFEKNPSEDKEFEVPKLQDGLYPTEHGRLRGK
jgi:hypothetical protein